MNDRRSQIQILIDILRLIHRKGQAKPTHILYGANLSHKRLKKYLDLLKANGFIEETGGSRTYYRVTTKGYEFMKEFRKIEKVSDAFGIPL